MGINEIKEILASVIGFSWDTILSLFSAYVLFFIVMMSIMFLAPKNKLIGNIASSFVLFFINSYTQQIYKRIEALESKLLAISNDISEIKSSITYEFEKYGELRRSFVSEVETKLSKVESDIIHAASTEEAKLVDINDRIKEIRKDISEIFKRINK